ncbi:MAG: hypothetical protein A3G41_00105 [Elusimicrobia bacterium RIFCSPLOWO2_12_FULL_59_9]|nr:MAG: hypothetical protein A3G41_00105 [Elusimicrobia bacterium RIFCSPLOWO2_12_FULL_59_9]
MSRIFSDPAVTGYQAPGHPEAPWRVSRSAERLKAAGHKIEPPAAAATEADLRLAHAEEHVTAVKTGGYFDADTPPHPDIYRIALTSLSGALSAADSAQKGEPAFSLMRPPGHHAGKNRIAGFCYFNNLAVACLKALQGGKCSRLAVLDIDVHHGDGTEEILLGREPFRFCSLHQSPLYPGAGLESVDNCVNIPLPPGTAEDDYLRKLEPALRSLLDFKPDILAVSAGFDTFKECPIAALKLDIKSYRKIGRMLAETNLNRFAVLEGGYAEALPEIIENFLDGFF